MSKHPITSTSKPEAAKAWLSLGVQVLPQLPAEKRSPFKWDSWLDGLDDKKIDDHWSLHPDHDLAIIPGDQLVVLDADTNEALAALKTLESAHQLQPSLYVGTRKGQHHYFRIPEDVSVKANSHSTDQHPERIDVRTGRHQVVVAPSTNKRVIGADVTDIASMVAVTQAFMDDLMAHNGQDTGNAEPSTGLTRFASHEDEERIHGYLRAMLEHLDPEEGGRDLWIKTLMAVCSATGGSDEGLSIADEWSSTGESYGGRKALESTWRSLRPNGGVTIATIIWRLREQGLDWVDVCDAVEPPFEVASYEVVTSAKTAPAKVTPAKTTTATTPSTENPLKRFSITSILDEVRAMAQDAVPALDPIALMGQATVMYAPPNTGKTLLTLHMLIQSIAKGLVDGSQVYYVNCDDSAEGLLTKGELAQQHGFEMLADGYGGFHGKDLVNLMVDMAASNQANGVVLILDTLKKFVNVMDKTEGSAFGSVCRGFCMKGGTVIALSHTNKNTKPDGSLVPGGTSDIRDDFDCAYVLSPDQASTRTKHVVEFKNIKRRGDVPNSVTFSFDAEQGYLATLASVRREDDFDIEGLTLEPVKQLTEGERILQALGEAISNGVNPQKAIVDAAMAKTGVGRAKVSQYLHGHHGVLWNYTTKERGAKHYELIKVATGFDDDLELLTL